jgi:hypothetical protein
MYPWFWFWSPQFQFPWSGNVTQDIDPMINSLVNIGKPMSKARIEKRAIELASYGEQLGLIIDVIVKTIDENKENAASLRKLKAIKDQIEVAKKIEYGIEKNNARDKMANILGVNREDLDMMIEGLKKFQSGGNGISG